MWKFLDGRKRFAGGKEDFGMAARAAEDCGRFTADEYEEWAADEETSCYNCRYRRWIADGFDCVKKA